MKITIEPTDDFYEVNGATCRMWKGRTEDGTECMVFVAVVAVPAGADATKFDAELKAVELAHAEAPPSKDTLQ